MQSLRTRAVRLLALALLASTSLAEAPAPGSVLVFPVHGSQAAFALLRVTNTASAPGQSVRALLQYVDALPNPAQPLDALDCSVVYRSEALTPADTVTVLTLCHGPAPGSQGYVVASARHPTQGVATSHDRLVGSLLRIGPQGSLTSVLPYSFRALPPAGEPTDLDLDGRLDFDGLEYERAPERLYLDGFLGLAGGRLSLLHLGTDVESQVTVALDVFNDNEFPLSLSLTFRCWFETPLAQVSPLFTQAFLVSSTPHDPSELDYTCDGVGDLETGWAILRGVVSTSPIGTQPFPAILGAVTAGPTDLEAGRLLWGDGGNPNGEF